MIEPRESRVRANGLVHRVLEWSSAEEAAPPIIMAHGFLDHAWSFHFVAQHVAAAGRRAIAFDWRGHGATEWIGAGGYYHFPDYMLDLAELAPALARGPYDLLGHSMGGTACAVFAGTRPQGLRSLVVCEGLGPPAMPASAVVHRATEWLEGVRKTRSATPKSMRDVAEAAKRMRVTHSELSEEMSLFLAERGTRAVEGGRAWSFDPLHRTTSPLPFVRDGFVAMLGNVAVPALVVTGERGFRTDDHAERVAAIPRVREVELDTSHMMHWYAHEALAKAVLDHVGSAAR